MAGGFWKSNNDLRNNLSGGRMDFPHYGGQNLMNRGYSNGIGSSAAALGFLKGMANQHTDMGQRNDRGHFQTGLDCYGASRSFSGHFQGAAQRPGMDHYNTINQPLVDTYRDYQMDNSNSINTFYMPRDSFMDRLPQSGLAHYAATERNLCASGPNQGGQFISQPPQVAGRKRAGGWDSGRGGGFHIPPNSQVNNRSKKGKMSQPPSMSGTPSKVKSITGLGTDASRQPLESEIIKVLRCVVCNIDSFNSISDFRSHMSDKLHTELLQISRARNAANLEYLRSEAKLAAKRNIVESRRKGLNVQKLLHCPVCRCDYYGTYAAHKLTLEHDQICKFDQAKCCGKFYSDHDKLVDHETTLEHFEIFCREQLNSSTPVDIPGNLKDFVEGNIYNIGLNNISPYEPHKPLGKPVLSEHEGYSCELCPEAQDLCLEDIKLHCSSLSHYKQIVKVLSEKSGKTEASIKKELKIKLKYAQEQALSENGKESLNQRKQPGQPGEMNQTFEEEDFHHLEDKIGAGNEDIDEDALDFENI